MVVRSPAARGTALRWTLLFLLVAAGGACGDRAAGDADRMERTLAQLETLPHLTPAELEGGERLFNQFCAGCHGVRASGTEQGPPLVHHIYEPGHHGDYAFVRAVTTGVRAHHWSFGDMPPIEEIEPEQIIRIIGYIRHLQREAGIH
ncbi:MAG TPA: c-type cytochrome [Longimicrobiaceae bacterium]|nr:c-type cytochrome [Longimicrobiaceae bacterium]